MKLSIVMLISMLAVTSACSPRGSSDNPGQANTQVSPSVSLAENEVLYWVNSLRADCVGVAPMSCLQVQEGDELKQDSWQLFYSSIDGFSYEAGYVYKLLLEKLDLPLEQVPEDASSIRYTLVKVLEKTIDARLGLNDIWALESIQGEMIVLAGDSQRPQLEIHLRDMKMMGNDGCNGFFASISALDSDVITFGPIAGTRKYCQQMNIPDSFNQQLNKVTAYQLKNLRLRFFDAKGEELLVFRKID